MTDVQTQAEALLRVAGPKVTFARRCTRGHRLITDQLGSDVANWSYADKGTEPGKRTPCAASDALADWRPSPGRWVLVLAGVPGTGKTISSARWAADRGGHMLGARDLDQWGYEPGKKLDRAKAARVLLIDDLGEERSPVARAHLRTILTARAASKATTVITTMLPEDGADDDHGKRTPSIAAFYGDHVRSRLAGAYRPLYEAEDVDRRSEVQPSLSGLTRAARLLDASLAVSVIAAGGRSAQAEDALAEFARLAGVDMEGETFRAAVEARAAEVELIERIAEEALVKIPAEDATAPMDTPESSALAWLDGLEIVSGGER